MHPEQCVPTVLLCRCGQRNLHLVADSILSPHPYDTNDIRAVDFLQQHSFSTHQVSQICRTRFLQLSTIPFNRQIAMLRAPDSENGWTILLKAW